MSVMSAETATPEYLKVPQVAAHLNVSRRTVYELLASGALRSVKVRGAVRVPREFLAEYEARLRGED
jgi:excisionase family DNA binding protein